MKTINELISRFNDIQDLPLSEEVLGAYVEGTLQGTKLDAVSAQISSDSGLSEMLDDVVSTNVEHLVETSRPWDVYEGDYGYWELGLPPVLSPSDAVLGGDPGKNDDFSVDGDRNQAEETLSLQNAENNPDDNRLNSNNMADNSKTIIYGEAGENISDPVFVQQPDDHSCALRSQQIVLRDFGIDIPFKDLEQIALDHQVYTNEGTYTYDIGKVLQLAGVGMHQTAGNTVDDLINELAQGHRVIVSVDADELWHNDTMGGKLKNWFNDAIGNQGGNHALIVAGVEVDQAHPENNKVILTDPGAGHLRIEYPMEQFKDAWGDSNCFMAATDEPAPYQYDAATGMEVPSNFTVQQYINDFVANNSYQLSPDMINIPQGYQPAFTGHLDVVGNVDYDTFKADYDAMVENRMPSLLSVKEQIEEVARLHEEQGTYNGNEVNVASHPTPDGSVGTRNNEFEGSNLSKPEPECLGGDDEDPYGDNEAPEDPEDLDHPDGESMTGCHDDDLGEDEDENYDEE